VAAPTVRTVPVVADDGAVIGVVSVDHVSERPAAERDTTSVEGVMVHLDQLPQLDADEPASRAFEGVGNRGVVVLTDHDRPVGVITAERLVVVAQRRARAERPDVAGRTPL
jgi:predicted transcriptional regulator